MKLHDRQKSDVQSSEQWAPSANNIENRHDRMGTRGRLPSSSLELVLGHVEDEETMLEPIILRWRQEDITPPLWLSRFQSNRLNR